jgi:cytochrome c-type biogenesis protein CcmH
VRTLFFLMVIGALPLAAQTQPIQGASQFLGQPAGTALTGAPLEKRTREVASLLRCPVCQGLSVYDSPAVMAVNMKNEVRELLRAGYTQDQVLSYFERSYGQFVRLEPPRRGINWLVWLGPLVVLMGGAVIVMMVIRKSRSSRTGVEKSEVDPDLSPYVSRAREMAYGAGDRPPESKA